MPRMPEKYPVGIQTFSDIIEGKYLYVDKTDLVFQLANEFKAVFLSRPRRFGKSLLTSTLESYFNGEKDLFRGLKISKLETEWQSYSVIHFDLSADNFNDSNRLIVHISNILKRYERSFGIPEDDTSSISQRFGILIEKAFLTTGKKVVILIDEYDKPLLDCIHNDDLHEEITAELHGFFSVVKAYDRYIRFAFLTGITKFSKVSVFSGLNNLNDISLRPEFNAVCGISEKEMQIYFKTSVKAFAEYESIAEEKIWHELKTRYDGYHFARTGEDIYNPISVIKTFDECDFRDYWFETGKPNFLFKLISKYNFEIAKLDSEKRTADQLGDISHIQTDIIPLLYQAGYLTIKSYDKTERQYTLGFPNREVSSRFWDSLAKYFFPCQTTDGWFSLQQFSKDLNEGNVESFMTRLKSLYADTSPGLETNKEIHFQNMTAIVAKMLGYTVETERHSSQGRCDMIIRASDYIYIFEFKLDGSPETALRQILEKGYVRPFESDKRPKILVGANFSTKTSTLDSWMIETFK